MIIGIQLDPNEARVFGVLIEKALTVPEYYPLTVNATTNAANQKSNRDPVLSLTEDEVADTLQRMVQRNLAKEVYLANGRVPKYCHNGNVMLGIDSAGLAVLAELLMRGPQTPGELRTRVSRMVKIESTEYLMGLLEPLIQQEMVRRLPPAPGSRAERYVQLLCPDLHPLEAPARSVEPSAAPAPSATADLRGRVEALETQVDRLRKQVRKLTEKLGQTMDDEEDLPVGERGDT